MTSGDHGIQRHALFNNGSKGRTMVMGQLTMRRHVCNAALQKKCLFEGNSKIPQRIDGERLQDQQALRCIFSRNAQKLQEVFFVQELVQVRIHLVTGL
jgi:hypothetical protein